MVFLDIIPYIENRNILLRILKDNELFEIQTDLIEELLNLYGMLPLKSIKAKNNILIITLKDI